MTKEEREKAIDLLDNLKGMIEDNQGNDYDFALKNGIEALKTLEDFERAQIITGGRLNGRTYAYKCGLDDGRRKALEQQPCEDCISRANALRVAKNEYLRGWHNALCKALSEKYSIHCEEGNLSVIQEETITGLGLSMDCAVGKDVESYMSTIPSVTPKGVTVTDFADKCRECGKQETVSRESYEHEYFLRKEFEVKIAKLEKAIEALEQEPVLEKVRADIIKYECNCRLSVDEYPTCKQCTDNVFESIYGIIDKYKAESEVEHD